MLRIPQLDDALGLQIYNLVIEDFNVKKDVTSDGIYAMSALSSSWKQGFLERLDNYWQFLMFALAKQEDAELFKAAIGSLADISRSCEDRFAKYLPQVIPSLVKCLQVFYYFYIAENWAHNFIMYLTILLKTMNLYCFIIFMGHS